PCYFFIHTPPAPHLYSPSLHDALPIYTNTQVTLTKSKANPVTVYSTSYPVTVFVKNRQSFALLEKRAKESNQSIGEYLKMLSDLDRKSTRLNSSHVSISYAVFCLKKKK